MSNLKGKKFIFGVIGIVCVTVATMYLKYDGEIYLKLIGAITLIFTAGQTITDMREKKGGLK